MQNLRNYKKNYTTLVHKPDDFKKKNIALALKLIDSKKIIRAKDVNKVLSHTNIKITDKLLCTLLNTKRIIFKDLNKYTINSKEFSNKIGTYRSILQVPGVYIWTHIHTNDKYVGSSSKLAKRLTGYFRDTHKSVGKFIPFLKLEGLENFRLDIIPLNDLYTENLELALEQYFLLHKEYSLNTLKLVDGYYGPRSKIIYMYNEDCTKLIYQSIYKEDFIFNFGIHHSTITHCLITGELYLNKFKITNIPYTEAIQISLSVQDIQDILSIEREKTIKTKGRKIKVISLKDDSVIIFSTISDCLKFFKDIGPSSKSTLIRHIYKGTAYHGYICTFEKDKAKSLLDSSIQVTITDITTGVSNVYTSFRKAALSFKPHINTTGQTIAKFAKSGDVFYKNYIIKISDNTSNKQFKRELSSTSLDTVNKEIKSRKWIIFSNIMIAFLIVIFLLFYYLFNNNSLISEDINIIDIKETEIIDYDEEIRSIDLTQQISRNKRLLDYEENDDNSSFQEDILEVDNPTIKYISEENVFNLVNHLQIELEQNKAKTDSYEREILDLKVQLLNSKNKIVEKMENFNQHIADQIEVQGKTANNLETYLDTIREKNITENKTK